jgi:hypothetical protein
MTHTASRMNPDDALALPAPWTPGPWAADKLPLDRWLIFAGDTNVAGTASAGFGPNNVTIEAANARLIAAAPEMAALLEEAERIIGLELEPQDPQPDGSPVRGAGREILDWLNVARGLLERLKAARVQP